MNQGTIVKVSGPLVIAEGMRSCNMFDVVRVSDQHLIGEIIEMHGDKASIQVYEETAGLGPGEPVVSTGAPLSVELGPGLIETIFDGIQRPLVKIREMVGGNITRGIDVTSLDRKKKWKFEPTVEKGAKVTAGDIIGKVQETVVVEHRIMIPYGVSGTVEEIFDGSFTVEETVAKVRSDKNELVEIKMMQKWPVRAGRPYKEKLPPGSPLVTGQRVIDTLFPLAKGGVAAVPGPFGSGKTVVQHQLAKWADAEIVIYIGCGERGNEMTDVLREFPELKDPRTGESLMKRTVLIANTSDMPVAAREASIYTGMTIAEYFRDMGYSVALMADSTSRWAEALREMSGRLEEMPGEEGYPALPRFKTCPISTKEQEGLYPWKRRQRSALTAIGAVSPPGGDIIQPVTQAYTENRKGILGLGCQPCLPASFPAINWLTSYSLYLDRLDKWVNENVARDLGLPPGDTMKILQEESELEEIVRLVGVDCPFPSDRLTLESAKSIREDYLHQNAFHEVDTYTSLNKQYRMLKLILGFYYKGKKAIEAGVSIKDLFELPVRERIGRSKYTPENQVKNTFDEIENELNDQIEALISKEVH